MSASKFIKCVTVGDGAVGKTCMLICYTSNKFPTWMPELRRFAPNVPIVLVGTKLDLRDDRGYLGDHMGSNIITTAQGEELRKQIGAAAYIECSSKTQQNVKGVFDTAIKVVLQPPRRKEVASRKKRHSSGCSIESYCLWWLRRLKQAAVVQNVTKFGSLTHGGTVHSLRGDKAVEELSRRRGEVSPSRIIIQDDWSSAYAREDSSRQKWSEEEEATEKGEFTTEEVAARIAEDEGGAANVYAASGRERVSPHSRCEDLVGMGCHRWDVENLLPKDDVKGTTRKRPKPIREDETFLN
ncbi:hypothetical protein SASPL_123756 [Salvia splendens]|uniref:Ras-related C3 botulinum toxin substrate 1 n=1 Tax=Salvia splendens TaxID=180675 RepID=A0A8X8XQW4_SALSN|nr:hypothetical protein SASPL_123756 [Salvia splendens]